MTENSEEGSKVDELLTEEDREYLTEFLRGFVGKRVLTIKEIENSSLSNSKIQGLGISLKLRISKNLYREGVGHIVRNM